MCIRDRYSNSVATTGDLPDSGTHDGMFALVVADNVARVATSGGWKKIIGEDHTIGDLSDVDLTVGGGQADGQVLKWNSTNSKWEPANDDSSGGGGGGTTQNLFETVTADTGTTTASAATDTLIIAGGTNIATSITGDTVTVNMTGTLGDVNQNAYGVIGSDSGS